MQKILHNTLTEYNLEGTTVTKEGIKPINVQTFHESSIELILYQGVKIDHYC